MNRFPRALLPLAALALSLLQARAESAYSVQDLGPAEGPGSANPAFLNGRGEVLYSRSSPVATLGYWLPRPNYGLSAGFHDLPGSRRDSLPTLIGFSDDGSYYLQTLLPHGPNDPETEWAVVLRGTVAGESEHAKVIHYPPILAITTAAGDYDVRQRYVVAGVAQDGTVWGQVQVEAKPAGSADFIYSNVSSVRPYSAFKGRFRGPTFFPIPGEATYPECGMSEGFPLAYRNTWFPLASSRDGTFLTKSQDSCYNFARGTTANYATTLAVIGRGGTRLISVQGTDRPTPEIDPIAASTLSSVNDRGDAVGSDGKGVWYSAADGRTTRLPLTVASSGSGLLNQAGWFLLPSSSTSSEKATLWNGRITQELDLPWSALGYAGEFFPRQLNDRGEILGVMRRASDNLLHGVLLTPAFTLDLAASSRRIPVGERFTVTASVTNLSPGSLTTLAPKDLLEAIGSGKVKPISSPVPVAEPTLLPDGAARFVWTLEALEAGPLEFSVAVQAQRGASTLESLLASTGRVQLVDRSGDLLIKRSQDPDSAFAIAGFQVPTAVGAQLQTVLVKSNEVAGYSVRLRNVGRLPRTFTLLAQESGDQPLTQWQRTYRAGNQDLTTPLLSPAGFTTPEIPTNGIFDLQLSLRPTSAPEQARFRVALIVTDGAHTGTAQDAVEIEAQVSQLPVELSLHRLQADGLTRESIQAGQTLPNAPLVPIGDPATLLTQPLIHGGLVADGVTPLVIELSPDLTELLRRTEPQKFRLRATITGGGELLREGIESRLRLLKDGVWTRPLTFQLSPAQPRAWAQLTPLAADELRFQASSEVSVRLEVVSDDADATLHGNRLLRLRHPPLALIHGYNTAGDWGPAVLAIFSEARGGTVGDSDAFVRVCRYGLNRESGQLGPLSRLFVYANTVYPLRQLAPLAGEALQQGVAPLADNWAFTRHDVVAHSQGGLLTRMLCSQRGNQYVTEPYRNEANHFRGRFHRVVTVGSPHNGSRLLRYLLALADRRHDAITHNLPRDVSTVMVFSDTAQEKFDPFGEQIRELNSTDPDGPWRPDPHARFHLVRAVINGGLPPSAAAHTPADVALNFAAPGGGAGRAVIPSGSDGVVDFDSMGAHNPNQPPGANVWTHPPAVPISHAGPIQLWNATAPETGSVSVAQHVIAALDQDPSVPAGDRVFGSFVPPRPLAFPIRDEIDGWAALAIPVGNGPGPFGGAARPASDSASFAYQLPVLPEYPVVGEVLWSAWVFGPDGLTQDGVDLTQPDGVPTRVQVAVAPEVVGDVVLYSSYGTSANRRVYLSPVLVTTQGLDDLAGASLEVFPQELEVPTGAQLPVEYTLRLPDGRQMLRFVAPGQATATTSPAGLIDVSDSLTWVARAPGTADIITTFAGLRATNRLSVVIPPPVDVPLRLDARLDGEGVVLSWPALIAAVVESTGSLESPTWQPTGGSPVLRGETQELRLPTSANREYFRLRRTGGSGNPGGTPEERLGGVYGWNRSGAGGHWNDPANWDSTALAGAAPIAGGLGFLDVTFGPAAEPVTSLVEAVYGLRSLAFQPEAPAQVLAAGADARLNLGAGGMTKRNPAQVRIEAPLRLATDQTWQLDAGTLTVTTLDLQSGTLTVKGAGTLVVTSLTGTSASRLLVQGPGRVEVGLAATSTGFPGALVIQGGTLQPGIGVLNGAAGVELAGGTLSLPLNAALNSTATWRLLGGTLQTQGATGNLGLLHLFGDSRLELGLGTGALRFSGSQLGLADPHLTIAGWQGTPGLAGTGRRILLGSAPTPGLLERIRFEGPGFANGSLRLASGELVPLPQAQPVLPNNWLAQTIAYGAGSSVAVVSVAGQPFSQALQAVTTQKPAQVFNTGIVVKTGAAVAANDNLLARFWIRRIAPAAGNAQVMFNFELASGTFEKSVQLPVTLSDDSWQLKTVKFKAKAAYAAGAAEASFWTGYGVQTVQIGGLEVLNYQALTPP